MVHGFVFVVVSNGLVFLIDFYIVVCGFFKFGSSFLSKSAISLFAGKIGEVSVIFWSLLGML